MKKTKTIYILKDFMGFKEITKEKANLGIKEKKYYISNHKYRGVGYIFDREDDIIKIDLLVSAYLIPFGLSNEQFKKLTKEFYDYVESKEEYRNYFEELQN